MPIFEYACKGCGKEFEALVLKTTPAPSCPACKGTELEKLISRPAIKSESTHGLAMKAAQKRDKKAGSEKAREQREYSFTTTTNRPTGHQAIEPSGNRMPIETASGQAQCPECLADVTLSKVMQNEITQCPGCGAELEITALEPITLALAPQEEEDWGE